MKAYRHVDWRNLMKTRILLVSAILLLVVLIASAAFVSGCRSQTGRKTQPVSEKQPAEAPAPGQAGFTEYPIGDPKEVPGLTIAAVYFQPVEMEPQAGPAPVDADIHLEADIAAAKGNKTGFGVGEFVPNLTVGYKLKKLDSGEVLEGNMMPMNASDGAHYGNNVKMLGAGNYELTFIIDSPEKQGYVLHVDKETGVEGRFWKKPIELNWNFSFVPRKWR